MAEKAALREKIFLYMRVFSLRYGTFFS